MTYTHGRLRDVADRATASAARLEEARRARDREASRLRAEVARAHRAAEAELRAIRTQVRDATRDAHLATEAATTIAQARRLLPLYVAIHGDTPELQAQRRQEAVR